MLILTRKEGEAIRIGAKMVVHLLEIRGDRVRLGIEGPRDVPVVRTELTKVQDG